MGLFGKSKGKKNVEVVTEPVDPGWYRTSKGGFPALSVLDPEELGLAGKGGVVLIWHGGIKPEWVYVAHSTDIAQTLHEAGNNKDIFSYEGMGGLFVTWAFVLEDYRPGVVRFLQDNLPTIIPNDSAFNDDTVPVPVFSPGKEPKAGKAPEAPQQP